MTRLCRVLLVAPALTACSGGGNGAGTADCAAAIRQDGTVFVEAGWTKHQATPAGRAERAECHDVGKSAPGTVFTEDARTVRVVALAGESADQVLGVREGSRIHVFVAEDLDTDKVVRRLREPEKADSP